MSPPRPSNKELEAKFVIARHALHQPLSRGLREALKEAGFRVEKQGRTYLTDRYLDTPEGHIHTAGWILRERVSSAGNAPELTLKQHRPAVGPLFRRTEISQPLPNDLDDPFPRISGPVGHKLAMLLPASASVITQFTQATRRRRYTLSLRGLPGAEIEMADDRVTLESGVARYREFEFELRRGPVDLLNQIAFIAAQRPGLCPARMSKYDRALFHRGLGPAWPTLDVSDQSPLPYLEQQMRIVAAFAPFAWEGIHPEGVHQLRVGLRRMQSVIASFEKLFPAREQRLVIDLLAPFIKRLGAVRDLDVQLQELASEKVPAGLLQHLRQAHARAQSRLQVLLSCGVLSHLERQFEAFLASARAQGKINHTDAGQLREPLTGELARLFATPRNTILRSPKQLHRLRLDIKQLNYALECAPLEDANLGARLAALQKKLGDYQDTQVALRQLRRQPKSSKRDRLRKRYRERARSAHRQIDRLLRILQTHFTEQRPAAP